ncbi:hypothetical protein Enr13x_27980 [Stieleria neptunia]|uniref:Uncharacterized protein n=1 Tax=Stieleria neptunia TaxID=2527979 RepID=A0A518HQ21_9BACT|nr:hypothetical protein Enr13x_27980 [Stieleria neptunia]
MSRYYFEVQRSGLQREQSQKLVLLTTKKE